MYLFIRTVLCELTLLLAPRGELDVQWQNWMSRGKKLNNTSKTLKNLEILESVVLRTAMAPLLGGGTGARGRLLTSFADLIFFFFFFYCTIMRFSGLKKNLRIGY